MTLDENALAEGHEFLAVRGLEADPGGHILAWGQDTDGSERFTIRFRDLATGERPARRDSRHQRQLRLVRPTARRCST